MQKKGGRLIEVVNDLRYAKRSDRNVLDLAMPRSATNPPLVVYIHGGAFRSGDKSNGLRERHFLVDAGFAVASVNYRYSTEAIWPAQLDDLCDAFAFLRGKADEFHFDSGRVASFGPSAGGHLSATCGIVFAASPQTRLAASVVWYPPVDFTAMDSDLEATGVARATGRNDLSGSPESILIGATVADHPDLARAAGPIARLEALPRRALLPSFLIMHGGRDPFIAAEQSRRLHRALASFGGSPRLELDVLPNGTHGGGDFERPETMARVVGFLEDCFEQPNRDNPTK